METEQLDLVSWLKAMGADLVGFAPVERFTGAPAHMHPLAHLPTARTVIVIGIHHPDAAIEFEGDPTPYYMGTGAIQGDMNTKLEHLAYWLAKRLDRSGHRTVTIPSTNVWRFRPFTGDGNVFTPDLSNIHAAAAAGLGEIGLSGLFLSPEFGPRQRLECIITEAEFEPTPMYDGDPLCDRCMECVQHCPMDAFRQETDGMSVVDIGGSRFEYVKKNKWCCAWIECFGFNVDSTKPDVIDERAVMRGMEEHGRYGGVPGRCLRFCLPPGLRSYDEGYSPAPHRTKPAPQLVPVERLRDEVETKTGGVLAVLAQEVFGQLRDDPTTYLPGCRSVLLVGRPRQSAPSDQAFVDRVLAESLRHATLDLTRILEAHGHEAMPLPHRLGKPYPALALIAAAGSLFPGSLDPSWHWESVFTTADLPLSLEAPAPTASRAVDANAVLERAREAGADLVGVAAAEQIQAMLPRIRETLSETDYEWDVVDGAREHATPPRPEVHFDPGFRFLGPYDYLQQARSVIVLGVSLPSVVLERAAEEPALAVGPYSYLQFQTPRELVLLGEQVARELRATGHHAVLALDLCRTASRVTNPRGRQYDAWANRFAAVAAGLAAIGRHGAPITPEYGVHQRFLAIVTDAELAPTPPLSRPSPCAGCDACVSACPVSAIGPVREDRSGMGAIGVDKLRCDWAKRYAFVPEEGPAYCGSTNDIPLPSGDIRPDHVFAALKRTDPLQKNLTCVFERCLKACPGFQGQGEGV